jgi:hypothetical protein
MAKKRKTKKKSAPSGPSHKLPAGFWQQVIALGMVAFSILLIVAWFGVGGPVLEWIQQTALQVIGYAIYVVPLLFVYVSVEIFRAEENKLPLVMKIATALLIIWLSGLFGLIPETPNHGGWVGEQVNAAMLSLVDGPVAGFIYVLLILVTTLFVIRVSPITIIKKIWDMLQTEKFDDSVKVMREAADKDKKTMDFKLNAGVPTLDSDGSGRCHHFAAVSSKIKPPKIKPRSSRPAIPTGRRQVLSYLRRSSLRRMQATYSRMLTSSRIP